MSNRITILLLILGVFFLFSTSATQELEDEIQGCTVIGVGKLATVDGSVITSHTDCCSECRVHVVPGKKYKKGEMAPVYWGMVYFGKDDERGGKIVQILANLEQNVRQRKRFPRL